MKVTTYIINKGTSSQYYGLKNAKENQVLYYAPNNWKLKDVRRTVRLYFFALKRRASTVRLSFLLLYHSCLTQFFAFHLFQNSM